MPKNTKVPNIGDSVKLKKLTDPTLNRNAYANGFIDLASVEPSLGLPSGTTNTVPDSAYYFPIIGIDPYHANSRKFTGNDSLIFKNKNLGINNQNPVYDLDINGNLNVLSGANIQTLSAINLVPSSLSNTLSVQYPGGVNFNSDVYFNNNIFVNNAVATSLVTSYLSALSSNITNKITVTLTLSNANVNTLNITGNLTANNITVLNTLSSYSISASNIIANSITSNTLTINNQLSVGGDIYASNVHGYIDLDPNSILKYNGTLLSINTSNNYTFAVRPSDSYSTDDPNVPRTLQGSFDSSTSVFESNFYKPFFKTLRGALNYVDNINLTGNSLYIYIDEDIVEGESQRPAVPNPNDNSGNYISPQSYNGNMRGAFYSTEWLTQHYPNMVTNGIKGGNFYWSSDGNIISGFENYITIGPEINFDNIIVQGRTEIGVSKNIDTNTPPLKMWTNEGKIYDTPSNKISFRTYYNNTTASFGNFGNQNSQSIYNNWIALSGMPLPRYARPLQFGSKSIVSFRNLILEFDSNAYDSSAVIVYDGGQVNLSNITIALLGTAPYAYGAICSYQSPSWVSIRGTDNQLDPYYYSSSLTYPYRNKNSLIPNAAPYYYPGHFTVIGNPSNRNIPTMLTRGFLIATNGGTINHYDYGATSRNYGYGSLLNMCSILDGNFNSDCYYYFENNTTGRDVSQFLVKGNTFALSSYAYNDSFLPTPFNFNKPLNFRYFKFSSSFSKVNYSASSDLYTWNCNSGANYPGTVKHFYYPFNYNGKHNADSTDPYLYNPSSYTVNLSAFIYGTNTNLIDTGSNYVDVTSKWILYYRPLSDPQGMANFNEYYTITSPDAAPAQDYTLGYYRTSTR